MRPDGLRMNMPHRCPRLGGFLPKALLVAFLFCLLAACSPPPPLGNVDDLEDRLAADPDNVALITMLATQLSVNAADVDRAMSLIETALARDPKNVELLRTLAQIHHFSPKADLAKAAVAYERLIAAGGGTADVYTHQEMCLLALGRPTDAEAAYLNAIRDAKEHGAEYNRRRAQEFLGRLYAQQGRTAEAEAVLKESAANLDEFNAREDRYWGCPYQALGELYQITGQVSKVAAEYMKAADAESDKWESQLWAAVKCWLVADYANAQVYMDRAFKLADKPALKVFQGALWLFQKRYDEAERLFGEASAELPEAARVGRAHLALIRKDYPVAEREFRTAIAAFDARRASGPMVTQIPEFDPWIENFALLGLGWTLANQNRHAEALDQYFTIVSRNKYDLLAGLARGNSLTGLQRLDEAQAVFDELLSHYPDNPYLLAETALVQYNRGEDAAAEANFKKALAREDKNYTCPYEGLGLVYLRQGKVEDAKKNFEKAIEINPGIEYKKFNGLAKIYIKEGRVKEARELLERSVHNYPHDGEAARMLKELDAAKTP
ncbi:MAG: tetratricopeptide repeat protein [Deltaproteobacteria bacterium]|nr:tetratricopeptide repeat protein [Deltaproteobacteria bacterium]